MRDSVRQEQQENTWFSLQNPEERRRISLQKKYWKMQSCLIWRCRSTNAVLHILAYAYELGIKITLADFEKYAKEIYCINAVIPSGPYTVVDFHYAGGVKNVMKQLESKFTYRSSDDLWKYMGRTIGNSER